MKDHRTLPAYAFKAVFTVLIVFLFSCKKEKECYKCTTTFDITQTYMEEKSTWSVNDTNEFCDMTEEEKNEYELLNTGTTTEESSGIVTVTRMTTKCTK